ncbi:isochorismate synthase MenF [Hafnia psychrotolerans]|uniref:Isochorismate synthase MenF n=2 Tax=Enterobacterales TaxID=91347 RepID=A0ABQ1FXN6_9GAMM|nr:isochorismate synthase MenF [Hafnia psychrotolerans]GGA32490.1 menaquinone-specific isochorismate synthase [Hafnia psychrotolerans]
MKQISAIIDQLDVILSENFPDTAGLRQFSYVLVGQPETDMLEWLNAQSCYPKFYWQQRDEHEEVALCSSARTFGHLSAAQAFLQQYPQLTELRIWGLNAFHGADAMVAENIASEANTLFLPRIEISRRDNQYTLLCHLYSTDSLRDEARQMRIFLRSLVKSRPLPVLTAEVLQHQHLPTEPQWKQMIHTALTCIEQGQFDKVVLARKTTLTLRQPLNAAAFLAASRAVNHHCYHFMLAFTAQKAFLGSSPERLFLRESHALFTEALAGTVAGTIDNRKAQELGQWLLKDAKNQRENMLVVDDICQRLQGGTHSLDVTSAEILRLRKVQHLRRSIHAVLTYVDDADCLQRLQPTAAVAGLPRQAARDFIAQHEPFNRQWYAGSAGYISLARSEFAVALRSAAVNGSQLDLFAGAGIVAGSDAAQEWLEIENKAAGLRTLLDGNAQSVENDLSDENYAPAVRAG